ncbi:MAG: hypothetical protein M1450_03510 [Patescibacteria group bacterium]|nr:hypothetical protein [Patescibacteria group bacterium]
MRLNLLNSGGKIHLAILGVVFLLAIFLAGGFLDYKKSDSPPPGSSPSTYTCCDTGDGDACKLVEDKKFTFRGAEYDLIKSSIALLEKSGHIAKAPETGPDDKPIFLNTTDSNPLFSNGYPGYESICKAGDDYYFNNQGGCIGIPNDQIIFLCQSGENCNTQEGTATFDAYYRKDSYAIPDFIKNCAKPVSGNPVPGRQIIVAPTTAEPERTLQLRTFGVRNESFVAPWLSPYCKPAIYLYPKEKTDVNVKIAPLGPLTLTIPEYPKNSGWHVTAYPNGKIDSGNSSYNYLYYEAEIPNNLIEKPKEGFVVKHNELSVLFKDLLPKLGLNDKESKEFSDYWLKALPKSNYYFIGAVPKTELDKIAPLDIKPVPDNVIRVTLYFEALDKKINVPSPSLPNIKRDGFTVVEWGGLFKTDESHPFTCLM